LQRKNIWEGAEEAERILMKMIQMHAKDGNAEVKPTAQLFYSVIKALSKVGSPDTLDRAEKMLMKMVDLIDGADSDMKTQLYSFASVINSYSRLTDRREGSHKRVFDMIANSRKPCCSSKLKLEMDIEMIYLKHL
jgi:hypothetical protein